jgi:hypothetical protein
MANGSKCSINGKMYERTIQRICQNIRSPHMDIPLNTQLPQDLGGSCAVRPDLCLNWNRRNDTHVEVKRNTAPDWVQATLCHKETHWYVKETQRNKHTADIFNSILQGINVYPTPPPFVTKSSITFHEWNKVKHLYTDTYVPCADDTIARAYHAKGVHYIQLQNFGLYHTSTDVCNLGTPKFLCTQRLRIRMKRHGKRCKETGKHVPSSVMASFRPVFKTLQRSSVCIEDGTFRDAIMCHDQLDPPYIE